LAISVYLEEKNKPLFTRRFYAAHYPFVDIAARAGREGEELLGLVWPAGGAALRGRTAAAGGLMELVGEIYVIRWGSSIVFIGLMIGAVAVIFPPLPVAGVCDIKGRIVVLGSARAGIRSGCYAYATVHCDPRSGRKSSS
jgi:hypothetical protein